MQAVRRIRIWRMFSMGKELVLTMLTCKSRPSLSLLHLKEHQCSQRHSLVLDTVVVSTGRLSVRSITDDWFFKRSDRKITYSILNAS
jgi:hypothetical protein